MPAESLPEALRPHAVAVDKLLQAKATPAEIASFLAITEDDVLAIRNRLVNKSALIRAQLATGPKTTRDIVEATRLPMRVTSALLSILRKSGRVTVTGLGPRSSADPSDLHRDPVYALTDSGRARMRRLGEVA